MKKCLWIFYFLFACINACAQSAWKEFPEKAEVERKKLRNTFTSTLYNNELQIEQANVVNNRTLQLWLKSPLHSLVYKSEVTVKRKKDFGKYEEIMTTKPEKPQFFLAGNTIRIALDLSSIKRNGEYHFTFQLHTVLKETYYVKVVLRTEEFHEPMGIVAFVDYHSKYEELQKDENRVYTWVRHHADFPGGNTELVRFIEENVQHEKIPVGILHSVTVGMIIEKDGSILYPEVVYSNIRELDAEAMRLVNMMPKWKPGTIDGVKVRQRAYVNFMFDKLEMSAVTFDAYYPGLKNSSF